MSSASLLAPSPLLSHRLPTLLCQQQRRHLSLDNNAFKAALKAPNTSNRIFSRRLRPGRHHYRDTLTPSHLPPPHPSNYSQTVVLSNGQSFKHFLPTARSLFKLQKDLSTNPLWYPSLIKEKSQEDETGSIARFKARYGSADKEGAGAAEDIFGLEVPDWLEGGKAPALKKEVVFVPVVEKGKGKKKK